MSPFPAVEAPAAAGALAPVQCRVTPIARETHDTWTFAVEPVGAGLERFAPGQFAMLYAWGAGEAPISVSGGVEDGAATLHTVRDVGAVTHALCSASAGTVIGVRGPFGTAWPLEQAAGRDVVIVAGGIGLAPVRPIVHRVLADRARYGRLVVLIGSRSPADLLYAGELAAWAQQPGVEVAITVDTADAGWHGRVGLVTTLIPRARFDRANAIAMLCGPEIMMRFAAGALRDTGMAPGAIHVSMERSMKCATGHCGHCQLGPFFICKDGPVFALAQIEPWMGVPEL